MERRSSPSWYPPTSPTALSPSDSHDHRLNFAETFPRISGTDSEDSEDDMIKPGGGIGVSSIDASVDSPTQGKGALDGAQPHLSPFELRWLVRLHSLPTCFESRSPRIHRAITYLRGPNPPIIQSSLTPLLPRVERYFDRLFAPLVARRVLFTPLYLLMWLTLFTFLINKSYFSANTSEGTPKFIAGDDSFWVQDAGCGLNGTYCTPFTNVSLLFRCPAQALQIQLLGIRAVGSLELDYSTLVVGGLDSLSTYRGDSWICPAAIQHGLFKDQRGGCGKLETIGEFTGFVGGRRNGVDSVSFDGVFPSSYRFADGVTQFNCVDLRDDISGFNVAMITLFSFVVRPSSAAFFWTLFCMGYWHVVLVSDPTANPRKILFSLLHSFSTTTTKLIRMDYAADLQTAFQSFLPAVFAALAIWRCSFRWVLPAFQGAVLERTVLYLGGYWVGVLINVWIPIDRLTPHDIQSEPGGLAAVICVAIFLLLVVANQLRVIRKTGWLFYYLKWYLVGGGVLGLLCAMPGLQFRLHHYIAALLLLPGTGFVTRPSALFQGFLLGMFLDGVGRWGFDSILETAASLGETNSLGSALPSFVTSATTFSANQTTIEWEAIPDNVTATWRGFALIIDDVLAWTGTATTYSIATLNNTIPHYFRLGYEESSGTYGDFTKAATAYISNGTWIDALSGTG